MSAMSKRTAEPSTVEIVFTSTPDGLVVDRVVMRPRNAQEEVDLRRFLERFRDPELDLEFRARWERAQ